MMSCWSDNSTMWFDEQHNSYLWLHLKWVRVFFVMWIFVMKIFNLHIQMGGIYFSFWFYLLSISIWQFWLLDKLLFLYNGMHNGMGTCFIIMVFQTNSDHLTMTSMCIIFPSMMHLKRRLQFNE
jgi:hypothetical protein